MSDENPAIAVAPPAGHGRNFEEIRGGDLGVRLAETEAEIDAAQALRYRVFYEEMGAIPDVRAAALHRDTDAFDAVADHLLVLDHGLGDGPQAVVGTYRLIRQEAATRIGRFYSSDEYDLTNLLAFPGRLLELGRSCIRRETRGRVAMQLLWAGIAAYVAQHGIDLMFGCASLSGTDPDAIAAELTYLAVHHQAPPEICPRALPHRYVEMRRRDPASFDHRRVLAGLPPLVKGYLRLGGFVGEGAVIDQQFNTVDVAVLVKTELVTDKYLRHYERQMRDPGA